MSTYGPITACQHCTSTKLRSALFLGYLPPVNTMRPIGAPDGEQVRFPAELRCCTNCHLAQLGYAVDPRVLFPPEYPYTSGTTKVLRDNFRDLYREVMAKIALAPSDLIVDIGSNDGTLLSNFAQGGHRVVGIEPSLTARLAQERGIPTRMAFFDAESAAAVRQEHGRARVVTATNVFAHILDVHAVLTQIGELLEPNGMFISESHYLGDLIETLQYDTIYHEHLRYYSLTSVSAILSSHGFRVVSVTRIPTHGGSIRVYATRDGSAAPDDSVARLLQDERAAGLADESWIDGFRARVAQSKAALYTVLEPLVKQGARIYGIGAPSRASSLITYLGLDEMILPSVMEVSGSKKLNHYMPGTRIEVRDETLLYQDQPEYVLLLSWHIAQELCRNLTQRGYRGDFIVPLPTPRIIRHPEAAGDRVAAAGVAA